MSALSVLTRYPSKHLRPGENDQGFEFEGPGLVAILREDAPKNTKPMLYKALTAVNAEDDALAVARNLLERRSPSDQYVFAVLLSIPDQAERQKALKKFAPVCIEGI